MYINVNIEINIHKIDANIIGFIPVDFKSVIEIDEPIRNNVNTNNLLEPRTIKLVVEAGIIR